MKLLLRGMLVLPMAGDDVLESGEIAIADGRIVSVGALGSAPSSFIPDEVIDAAGMVATPGLVNVHSHAAMVLLRGYADDMPLMTWLKEKIWPAEDRMSADDVYWGSLLACAEMIRGGTTFFADMYFFMEEVARAVSQSGMRAFLSRGLIGSAPNADEALAQNTALVQNWHGAAEGRITCGYGPHAPYTCPPDYLKKVMDAADRMGVGLHIHIGETRAEVDQIRTDYGFSPVTHLGRLGLFNRPVLAAHCVHLDDADIEILVQRGVGIAHCPQSNMKLASGIAPVNRLIESGAQVGIGTDGASSNNDLDMIEEMRTASLLQKVATEDPTVMPAAQAAELATVGGARAVGLMDQIGTIEVGKRADIVLWDWRAPHLNPAHDPLAHLVYAAKGSDARMVIIDGQIVMRDRVLLTIDEEKVMAEAARCASRLVSQ